MDYRVYIENKIEEISKFAGSLPDNVVIFIVKFEKCTDIEGILPTIQGMEAYLRNRIPSKEIAVIPVVGAEVNDIEVILPNAPLDRFIELENRVKELESKIIR